MGDLNCAVPELNGRQSARMWLFSGVLREFVIACK